MNFNQGEVMTAKEIEKEAYKEYCLNVSSWGAVNDLSPTYKTDLDRLCDVWWEQYNQTLKDNYIVEFKGGFEFAI